MFVRKEDGYPIARNTTMTKELPLIITNPGLAKRMKAVGGSIGSGGKGFCAFAMFMTLLKSYGANYFLGEVRSLSLITHLMMMQLRISAIAVIFFAQILEFVTFDIMPTEEMYAETFAWENEPYSDAADNIGYGSRVFVENTGSMPVYLSAIILKQLLVYGLLKGAPSGRIHSFAQSERNKFFWGGAMAFFDEMFIGIVFCGCIQTSEWNNETKALIFNNAFAVTVGGCAIFGPVILVYILHKLW